MGLIKTARAALERLRPRRPRISEDSAIDGAFVAGCAALVVGFAWIWHPLGPLAAGAILIIGATRYASGRDAETAETARPPRVVETFYSDEPEDD